MNVLDRILQLRMERGWSEYRLAEESGIAQTTISSWFRKQISPSIPSLEKICGAFHITLAQFFSFDDTFPDLTATQYELLHQFSRLSVPQQEALIALLKVL